MSKIWYCRHCGYEVSSRGRCHSCREKLTASALPELAAGNEDDEVGYRLDGWSDRDRGRLIERLNHRAILHRFEDDELVVGAEDEERVDDLVSEMTATKNVGFDDAAESDEEEDSLGGEGELDPGPAEVEESGLSGFGAPAEDEDSSAVEEAVRLLARAASRLETDPTDMQADGDVAEASTAIFVADGHPRADEETWAAIGRVTRRLLAVLGAEEALEGEIKGEAAVLEKLLGPLIGASAPAASVASQGVKEQTVYEMADWMPEQRAQLGLLLDDKGIVYEWDGEDLLVPSDREDEVEELFSVIGGVDDEDGDDDGEERYQAVAELFAACSRLAADPSDKARADAVLEWVHQVQGPPLLGMDEVAWFHIMTKAKSLVAAVEADEDRDLVHDEADALHDLLRSVV